MVKRGSKQKQGPGYLSTAHSVVLILLFTIATGLFIVSSLEHKTIKRLEIDLSVAQDMNQYLFTRMVAAEEFQPELYRKLKESHPIQHKLVESMIKTLHLLELQRGLEFYIKRINPKQDARKIASKIFECSRLHQVDPLLYAAIIHQESHFDPSAISETGAVGLAQLTTIALKDMELSKEQIQTVRGNLCAGAQFFALLLDRTYGKVDKALYRYNGGSDPGYVRAVKKRYKRILGKVGNAKKPENHTAPIPY